MAMYSLGSWGLVGQGHSRKARLEGLELGSGLLLLAVGSMFWLSEGRKSSGGI